MKHRGLVPFYYRVMQYLREEIDAGRLPPGARVPSERELTERFAVSRMTVRHALSELERSGYLVRIQGKGTFVATGKIEQPLNHLTSFTADMRRRGLHPEQRLLEVETLPAEGRVASVLRLPAASRVVQITRLRLADGAPMALEIAHIPAHLLPGFQPEEAEGSLYRLLRERYGLQLVRAVQSIEAMVADEREARLLGVREGAPLLVLERISTDPAGTAVEFTRSYYRGDRYRFVTELIAAEE